MDLKTYIADPDRKAALAAAIPISGQYLWQLANGWDGRQPSPKMAIQIETATAGQVSREELRPDIFGPVETKPAKRKAA